MTWTSTRQARELLASCAQEPPKTRVFKVVDASVRYEPRYIGVRVRQLRALHDQEWVRLLAAYDRGEASREELRTHLALDEQVAIRNAINNHRREAA